MRSNAIPVQAWIGFWGCKSLRLPEFLDNGHMKVASSSALGSGCLYPSGDKPGTHFC